jgi:hypothetical protein
MLISFRSASDLMTAMFISDFALDALDAQKLHFKFTAVSAH